MSEETAEYQPLGKCPCGQDIAASPENYSVIHSLPACDAFLRLQPEEFLRYVRRARGIAVEN